MILLALTKIVGHLKKLSINTRRTTIFQYTLPTVNYLTSPRRNSLPPSSHQHSRNIHRLFTNNPGLFKDFSSTTRKCSKHFHQKPENIQRLFRLQKCLSRKSSAPESIQRLFCLQNCLGRKSSIFRKYSKTFRPAATSKSNQQQQLAAAINSSNQ